MKNNNRSSDYSEASRDKAKSSKAITMKKKKNQKRLGGGGGGLSLEAFANAKTHDKNYNPALIKRQREFYKNAQYVNKYKKSLKQQNGQQSHPALATVIFEEGGETKASRNMQKNKRKSKPRMEELYEMNRQEVDKARLEREAMLKAKKEARERTEAERKALREKMYKKTRSGQPVMKHRIDHILQTLQGSIR